ncbi:hemagglutinin repeat-containing protein, partial [Serratia sp. (in: enterobacteria)]|uniref:hemagglutinin repeat-containing protein n=1 Tax=Serratia sp. (in: enterobacteria) TaxID=616 RepID=UPI00398A46F7
LLEEKKKSGLLGSGGIGFTIGKQSSKHEIDEKATTQSQSVSTVGSSQGSVTVTAGNQLHIGGADLVAGKDLSLTGDSVTIDPGYDQRTRTETYEQKQSGLSVALSGTVGSALNTAVSSAQQARKEGDGRLNALQNTKAALSGVQAAQAWERDNALTASAQGATNTVGISASYGSQSSKSETRTDSNQSQGSTLTAGQNLSITATGKNQAEQSGDIAIAGSQLKAGKDLSLDAARDITLQSAQNTESTVGKNSSKGGNVGVGIGVGSGGYGINVSAGVNAGKGHENGNGLTHTETSLDAGNHLSLSSGRDAVLGAVTAQLNHQSAAAGGLGAGGAELAARFIAGQLFPGKTLEQLSEGEKQQVSALSQLAAGLAGGLATGDTAGAVTAAQAGKNAVENNYLNASDKIRQQQLETKLANGSISDSEVQELADLTKKDGVSDANLQNACANGASAGCIHEIKLAHEAKESYQGYTEYQTYYDLRDQFPDEMAKFGDLIGDYSRDLIKLVDQGYTPEQAKAKMSQDAAYSAKYQQAIDDVPGWARIAMAIQDTAGIVYGAKAAGASLERLTENQLVPYRQLVTDVRAGLSSSPKRSGNVAVAEVDIPGMPKQVAAHSGVDTAGKGLVGTGSQNFEHKTLPNKEGALIPRNTDSEYKILDNLADQLGNNTSAKGSVTIFTERPACGSCLGVVDQFQKRYPGIQVNVLDNNGVLLTPRKKS